MTEVTLIQPRHNYAPPPERGPRGDVYMPVSLLTAAARLREAGAEVSVHDENLAPCELGGGVVGVNLLGAPYVGRAREVGERLRRTGATTRCCWAAKSCRASLPQELSHLFGPRAVNGNDDRALAAAAGVDVRALPLPQRTNLVPAYELVADDRMRLYMSGEFSFFLSQGCKFSCTFCAARRRGATHRPGRWCRSGRLTATRRS